MEEDQTFLRNRGVERLTQKSDAHFVRELERLQHNAEKRIADALDHLHAAEVMEWVMPCAHLDGKERNTAVTRGNAMQCNAMQCNAMQCNAMQCNGTRK